MDSPPVTLTPPNKNPIIPTLVGRRFNIILKIGQGSFGEIYKGVNTATSEDVAIKLEVQGSKHPQLVREAKIYKTLQGIIGIPSLKWDGIDSTYNVMVIELLGKSLENLLNVCSRRFTMKTVLMLADQLLSRLEILHAKCYIHRDIKPDNFLMGRGARKNTLYIIDFGLSKVYMDPRTRRHVPYKEGKNLTGTARYASVGAHLGQESSRKDDLQSLGYMLIYFLRGTLPWQGIKATNKKEKYLLIMEKKRSTSIEVLCKGFPSEFRAYFDHVKSLRFEDKVIIYYLFLV